MRIPKSFKLMGHTFMVMVDEKILVDESLQGQADYRAKTITVLPPDNHYGYNRSSIEQTFCHELFHHLFETLSLTEMQNDEKLIDNLGSLLHQFLSTQRGEQ